jgi:CubicO group peptidase (beta-lactamase class C family)
MVTAPDASPIDAIHSHFTQVAAREHVPGIAYGVMLEGRHAFAGGVGTVRAGTDQPPRADTPSRICSMTKSFVAAAVLLLRDEGLLRLDDVVFDHVPELASLELPTGDSPRITIRDLMSMSAGLPEDDAWADRHLDLTAEGVDVMFRGGATFSHPPGTAYEYSNLGWVMLGRVVTNAARMPVQAFVDTKILQPLGLSATSWHKPSGERAMVGHRWQDEAWIEEAAPLADGDFAPMAGLWSTVEDLVRWMSFLADAFPPREGADEDIISRSSRREMQQVHRAAPSEYDSSSGRLTAGGYGFGLVVTHDLDFCHVIGHPGGLPGFGSYMRWLPDRRVGVVALGNSTYAPLKLPTLEALEILDQLGLVPPPYAPPASPALLAARDGMLRLLEGWDDALVDELFAMNVFMDEDRSRRRAQLVALHERCGTLTASDQTIESSTRATFVLKGERQGARLSLLLSPEIPARVQWYSVETA